MLHSFVGSKKGGGNGCGQNFSFSCMNLDKKRNLAKKKHIFFPKWLCDPSDEYMIYILQECQPKTWCSNQKAAEILWSVPVKVIIEPKWDESNFFFYLR